MFLHDSQHFSIYFGNSQDQIYPQGYLETPADIFFDRSDAIQQLRKRLKLTHLFFARQVHGIAGIQVASPTLAEIASFSRQADFLHTSLPHVGIGVMTADCLPVVLIDPVHKAVAVIHAGWRGAVAGIVPEAVKTMADQYDTNGTDLQVFFGPSARSCCYEVGAEFHTIIDQTPHAQGVLEFRQETLFLDIPVLVKNQLGAFGILGSAISQTYNVCTQCDVRFFSYRRQGAASGRQMTVVALT